MIVGAILIWLGLDSIGAKFGEAIPYAINGYVSLSVLGLGIILLLYDVKLFFYGDKHL